MVFLVRAQSLILILILIEVVDVLVVTMPHQSFPSRCAVHRHCNCDHVMQVSPQQERLLGLRRVLGYLDDSQSVMLGVETGGLSCMDLRPPLALVDSD